MKNDLLAEFFANEFDEHVRVVLDRELVAARHAELIFNIFTVQIDPDRNLVTIQDDLEPRRKVAMAIDDFVLLLSSTP